MKKLFITLKIAALCCVFIYAHGGGCATCGHGHGGWHPGHWATTSTAKPV